MISEVLPYAVAVGAIIVALITIYITRSKKDEPTPEEKEEINFEKEEMLPLKGQRTVTPFDAQKSKKELRLLDVEREILSFGIRRIYEAHAEGKIDEKERDRLARDYKQQMREIKDSITEKESVVALHELESMQEDLIKLFNNRFDEINQKIGGLRMNLNITPKPAAPKPERSSSASKAEPEEDKSPKKKKEPTKPRKTEAEEKIDKIRGEVEKVLERLGQMETEA